MMETSRSTPLAALAALQRRRTANKPVLYPCVQSQRFLQYKISAGLRKGNAPFGSSNGGGHAWRPTMW